MSGDGPLLPGVADLLEAAVAEGAAPAISAAVLRRGGPIHLSFHGVLSPSAGRPDEARTSADESTADRPSTEWSSWGRTGVERASVVLPSGGRPSESRPSAGGPPSAAVRFDVASLTKPLCSATLCAQAVDEGALDLDEPVSRRLPGFGEGGKGAVTVRQLLAHSGGMPWWRPWHERAARDPVARALFHPPAARPGGAALAAAAERSRALMVEALLSEPLEAAPGAAAVYSDPGYVALGLLLEEVLGAPLPAIFEARVARPLGLLATGFRLVGGIGNEVGSGSGSGPGRHPVPAPPTAPAEAAFVPTGWSPARSEWLQGAVDDDLAWALGGAAGHAGLFSTAAEVAAMGQAWLDALDGRPSVVPAAQAVRFGRRDPTPGSTRALGWDTPSSSGSTLGDRLGRGPRGALGHLGWTGCSLWLDLDAGLSMALLTNHVAAHPGVSGRDRLHALRRRFHDAVAAACGIG
jgi:CubicO group peptidase (beta-lactamase class C family)